MYSTILSNMKTLASIPSCCAPEFRLCLTSDGDSHDGDGDGDGTINKAPRKWLKRCK